MNPCHVYDDCPGCTCFSTPPCTHCTDHTDDED